MANEIRVIWQIPRPPMPVEVVVKYGSGRYKWLGCRWIARASAWGWFKVTSVCHLVPTHPDRLYIQCEYTTGQEVQIMEDNTNLTISQLEAYSVLEVSDVGFQLRMKISTSEAGQSISSVQGSCIDIHLKRIAICTNSEWLSITSRV